MARRTNPSWPDAARGIFAAHELARRGIFAAQELARRGIFAAQELARRDIFAAHEMAGRDGSSFSPERLGHLKAKICLP